MAGLKGSYQLNERDLALNGEWDLQWYSYIEILKDVGVRIKAENDKLVYTKNKKNGIITAKLAYEFITKNWSKEKKIWWYKNPWKWNLPKKLKCFFGYPSRIRS